MKKDNIELKKKNLISNCKKLLHYNPNICNAFPIRFNNRMKNSGIKLFNQISKFTSKNSNSCKLTHSRNDSNNQSTINNFVNQNWKRKNKVSIQNSRNSYQKKLKTYYYDYEISRTSNMLLINRIKEPTRNKGRNCILTKRNKVFKKSLNIIIPSVDINARHRKLNTNIIYSKYNS